MTTTTAVNAPIITLFDGTGVAGVSRIARLSGQHRFIFQLQVANLGTGTAVLEGSNDGENFSPLIPSGESGEEIVLDGFYNYTRTPPYIRVTSTADGVVATGGV